jgi:S-adenosylmethionine:tRNA ribosyltransferase-isomerase
MDASNISIADYSYELPDDRIALYPLTERDASKLLIYNGGVIAEDIYRHLAAWLPESALLVFNNTRVVQARIIFQKPTGGQVEIFCLEPIAEYGGMAAALSRTGSVRWNCLIGGASKWKRGQVLSKPIGAPGPAETGTTHGITLEARYLDKKEDAFLIELSWTPAEMSFAGILHQAGLIPLPPYIHRRPEAADNERYQTVYGLAEGSVAAPTAGLHFTKDVFRSLTAKGIRHTFVTLHVGAGTFLPVKTATLGEHHMHIEFITVDKAAVEEVIRSLDEGRPIVPVGTTSARTLESLYWLGIKVMEDPEIEPADLVVHQWDPYPQVSLTTEVTAVGALTALMAWMRRHGLDQLMTTTQLLIVPGYEWKIASGLITNFHQPESTLLLLVASLLGEEWKTVYSYALGHDFRFLSYGDGCLLLP